MQSILNVGLDIDKIPLVADENNIIVFYTVYNNQKHIIVVSNREYIECEGKYEYFIEHYFESGACSWGPGYLSAKFTHFERKNVKAVPHKMINISYMANFDDYIINQSNKDEYEHNWKIIKNVFNNIADILAVSS